MWCLVRVRSFFFHNNDLMTRFFSIYTHNSKPQQQPRKKKQHLPLKCCVSGLRASGLTNLHIILSEWWGVTYLRWTQVHGELHPIVSYKHSTVEPKSSGVLASTKIKWIYCQVLQLVPLHFHYPSSVQMERYPDNLKHRVCLAYFCFNLFL